MNNQQSYQDNTEDYDYVWPFDFTTKCESEEPIRVPPITSETKTQVQKILSPFWHEV